MAENIKQVAAVPEEVDDFEARRIRIAKLKELQASGKDPGTQNV